ncbi:hypothetical protein Anas_08394 [Armadillidium nasatum]|uniref:Uncharacterized protein n=1 Tax=Armadillidium nasatum TaxID=96803 RepID=A0A5N5T4M9_9CRUS|nr:hypothetical protein Anas_08394 [Armadillidium nasatum]
MNQIKKMVAHGLMWMMKILEWKGLGTSTVHFILIYNLNYSIHIYLPIIFAFGLKYLNIFKILFILCSSLNISYQFKLTDLYPKLIYMKNILPIHLYPCKPIPNKTPFMRVTKIVMHKRDLFICLAKSIFLSGIYD